MKTTLLLLLSAALVLTAAEKTIRANLESSLAARKPAPAFNLENAAGKHMRNAEFRGKVLLLDFWATECGGCIQEIPSFIALQKTYGQKGLAAVGISMDIAYENLKGPSEAWGRVNPFVREKGVNYPILMGDDEVTKAYNIQAMPVTYLIDKSGRIAATYVGVVDSADIEANIKRLLSE